MAKHSLLTIKAMDEDKDGTVSKQEFMNSFLQILDQV